MEKDEQILDDVFRIEGYISKAYSYLSSYELFANTTDNSYKNLIELLKLAIFDEDRLLSGLSEKEKEAIFKYIKNNKELINKKYDCIISDNPFSKYILIRTFNRLKKKDENGKLLDYLPIELNDIFMSFLDEYIAKENNIDRKKLYINFKYYNIYISNHEVEKQLIDREFITDYSLFLSSKLIGDILCLSANTFNSSKDNFSIENINRLFSCGLLDMEEENDKEVVIKKISFLRLRSLIIMLSDRKFHEFISKFNKDGIKFVDLITKDRERHKILSLTPNKL